MASGTTPIANSRAASADQIALPLAPQPQPAAAQTDPQPQSLSSTESVSSPESVSSTESLSSTVEELVKSGRPDEALRLCQQRLAADPGNISALHCMGVLLGNGAEWRQALEYSEKVLAASPSHFAATINAGLALDRLGRGEEAIRMLERAVALDPQRFEGHYSLGNALSNSGQYGQAAHSFQRAMQLNPTNPDCLNNLGATLLQLGRPVQAQEVLRKAVSMASRHKEAMMNLADSLRVQDYLEEAEMLCRAVVAISPPIGRAYCRLGMVLSDQGRFDESLPALREAVKLDPDCVETHICLGITLLAANKQNDGWREYEWRRRLPVWRRAEPAIRPWQGQPLSGRTILLWGEQGAGDTLQFLRFAQGVKVMGATVIAKVAPGLAPLVKTIPGIDEVISNDEALPAADFQASLQSLPHLLGLTPRDISPRRYVQAPASRVRHWKDALKDVSGLKIGVAWAGNPSHRLDVRRSPSADVLALLPQLPGITYVNLQTGPRSEDFSLLGPQGVDHTAELTDYAETAGLIANLDQVVSVDTSVAHLAGGMGHPAMVLLPFAADWRWLREKPDSAWYQSVRLFRQHLPGQWMRPVLEVGVELARQSWEAQSAVEPSPAEDPSAGGIDKIIEHFNAAYFEEAEAQVWRTMAVSGFTAQLLNILGAIRLKRDMPSSAVALIRFAIECGLENAEIHSNLAVALRKLNRLNEAELAYRRAVTLEPNNVSALYNYANLLSHQGKYSAAQSLYERAVALAPNRPDIRYNLGNALRDQGKLDEAETCYGALIAERPNAAEPRVSMGMLHLLKGQFSEGWKEFEWRWRAAAQPDRYPPDLLWNGSSLNGRTLLLHAEQGLGDTLQFVRYAAMAAKAGGRILLEVPPELAALCRSVTGIAEILIRGESLPSFDCHSPLSRLPGLFDTRLESIPAHIPYLSAPAEAIESWSARLGTRRGLRVGLAWMGDSHDPVHLLTSQALAPLFEARNVEWFSLQTAKTMPFPDSVAFTDLGGDVRDYAAAAAAMSRFDLVICPDTAWAHLAGATGRPAWVLLPQTPEWRWMLDRDDSPWYPSLRLYRQSAPDDWSAPIARMSKDLTQLAKALPSRGKKS